MFNIRDIVKYKTLINSHENWGVIVEILNVEDSVHQETKGIRLYRINPLNTNRKFIGIEKDDKYFDIACNRINEYIDSQY